MASSTISEETEDAHSGPNTRPALLGLSALMLLTLAGLLAWQVDSLVATVQQDWIEIIFWTALVLVLNLLPIPVGELQFTLDMPVLLATALLYPPAVGASIALFGAVDIREFRRQVTVSRALFNRAQLALCILAASAAFHAVAPSYRPWMPALGATLVAICVSYLMNAFLVGLYTALRLRVPLAVVVRFLSVGRRGPFLATYLGYGILALVLAHLYRDVGAWAVVAFLVPTLAAHQMLVRGQKLQTLTARLRQHDRMLERMFDRIVDERRDERLRIAAELHDDILQSLIRIQQLGHFLQREVKPDQQAREDVAELSKVAASGIGALRSVLHDLRASPLGHGGLVPTLRSLIRDLRSEWGIPIDMTADSMDLPAELQVLVYQVTREALINSLRHSGSPSVEVRLANQGSDISMIVRDWGAGFSVEDVDTSAHFGLGLMRERVEAAGGTFSVESGNGTTIRATFPVAGK